MPLERPETKFCVVLGCKNTGHELKLWKKTRCTVHKNKLQEVCDCPAPFTFNQFPNDPKLRNIWLSRIGLPQLETNDSTCICSIHFMEQKPTPLSQFPTLFLESSLDLSDDEDNETVDNIIANKDPLNSMKERDVKDFTDDVNNLEYGTEEDAVEEFAAQSTSFSYNPEDEYLEDSEEEMEILCHSRFGIEAVELKMEDSGMKFTDENTESQVDATTEELEQQEESIVSDFLDTSDEIKSDGQQAQSLEDDNDVEILFHSRPQPPKPVASYDPQAQILQISNPVKYIQECHTRIAQLLAEKEQQKSDYEKHLEKLRMENKALRRKLLRVTSRNRTIAQGDSSRFKVVTKKGTNKFVVIRKDLK